MTNRYYEILNEQDAIKRENDRLDLVYYPLIISEKDKDKQDAIRNSYFIEQSIGRKKHDELREELEIEFIKGLKK